MIFKTKKGPGNKKVEDFMANPTSNNNGVELEDIIGMLDTVKDDLRKQLASKNDIATINGKIT